MAETQPQKLTIVGCGPGSPDYLTEAGRRAIDSATVLVGSPHLLDTYAAPTQEQIPAGSDIDSVLESIASHREHDKIAILVSGDPGLCSLAKRFLASVRFSWLSRGLVLIGSTSGSSPPTKKFPISLQKT